MSTPVASRVTIMVSRATTVNVAMAYTAPLSRPRPEHCGTRRRAPADGPHQVRPTASSLATANTADFPMTELSVEHWPIDA